MMDEDEEMNMKGHPTHQRAYERYQQRQQHMVTGPRLAANGHTLIVPSQWHNKAAGTFWRQHGFQFHIGNATWTRDTRLPLRSTGKRYAADTWLTSTRREFYRFWPTLANTERNYRRKLR